MSNILIHPNSGLIEFTTGAAGGSTFNTNFTGGAFVNRMSYDNYGGLNLTSYVSNPTGVDRFTVDGANGRLFSVTDNLSGSLFSVNDIAGLPIIEAFDDNTVIMGAFNRNDFVLTGNSLGLGGIPNTGTTKLFVSGNVNVSGNVTANNLVFNTGAQTISGLKTFSNGIVSSVGITGTNLVFNTGDQTISGVKTFSNGIVSSVGITGTNLVFNTGAQTISGLKTFSNGIVSSVGITGTNLVFNTGAQTISGLKTFSNGIVSSVGITGTNLVFNTGAQTISGVKTFANNIFAPTASFGTDTTQIATTAFVDNAVTSDQIMSTIGSNLITSLKSARSNEQNAGIYYFATYNNASGTFTVKTSSGRARVVNPTNGLDSQVGDGVAANNINCTLSSTSTNGLPRAFAVISVASGGSVRSGNINDISMPSKFVTNFDGAGLSGLGSLTLYSNSLTSFSAAGMSSLISLDLNDNSLTSFSTAGMPSYVTYINLANNSLTNFSATGVVEISILNLDNNSLTGVNMNNVAAGGYYTNSVYYSLGLDVSNNNLSADALDAMYTSLGLTLDAVIDVRDNPGAESSNASIATAKGYTVIGASPP